ncbi:MAG: phage GP46 family protein [Planctomycetota bacterium]
MSSLVITDGGDLALEDGDLVLDESLVSAVLVSLFCDAGVEDMPPGERRGYWADQTPDRPVGSLLWILERATATAETRARAQDDAASALRWLIDEGIAASVEVEATYERPDFLRLDIEITRGLSARHSALWDAFEAIDYPWEGGALRLRGA